MTIKLTYFSQDSRFLFALYVKMYFTEQKKEYK